PLLERTPCVRQIFEVGPSANAAGYCLNQCRQQIGCLSELDRYSFRIGARRAFIGLPVMIALVGWFDARKKHWQPALWASPLCKRRLRRIKIVWIRHGALLTITGGRPECLPVTLALNT